MLKFPVLTDTWLLHSEPNTPCGSACTFKNYAAKEKFNGLLHVSITKCSRSKILKNDSLQEKLENRYKTTYDHGFHLWKYPFENGLKFIKDDILKTFKVYYKDIIAEDHFQLVVKQIYICNKTNHPSESLIKPQEVTNQCPILVNHSEKK